VQHLDALLARFDTSARAPFLDRWLPAALLGEAARVGLDVRRDPVTARLSVRDG